MKLPLTEAAKRKFGKDVPLVDRILELEVGVNSLVIGTLYKEMKVRCTGPFMHERHFRIWNAEWVGGTDRPCGALNVISAETEYPGGDQQRSDL